MLGKLNDEKIDELLRAELLGRIGCNADGLSYIVPVHYAYKPPYIYAHSAVGMKINLMRRNPKVCFEVDKIENYFNWQSVVCWGTFEEITGAYEKEQAIQWINERIEPFLSKAEDAHPSHGISDRASDIGTIKQMVAYRIKLDKKLGKFEHHELTKACQQEI